MLRDSIFYAYKLDNINLNDKHAGKLGENIKELSLLMPFPRTWKFVENLIHQKLLNTSEIVSIETHMQRVRLVEYEFLGRTVI